MKTLLRRNDIPTKLDDVLSKDQMSTASDVVLGLGFASILASLLTWFLFKPKDKAHSERFGIFIGLWVPSFFILANHLARKSEGK